MSGLSLLRHKGKRRKLLTTKQMRPPPRYPRTPHWPWSPALAAGRAATARPEAFVGRPVVITEKLDGSCTLLHRGQVYDRSTALPSTGKWMAMVKKHHAWKVQNPDAYLYGEDIYGVHSIEYGPVPEDETFHAFGLLDGAGEWASFANLRTLVRDLGIPLVPVLFEGVFWSLYTLRRFVEHEQEKPSLLGGEREGVVVRLAESFPDPRFAYSVCKSVRAGHVQSGQHWSRSWRPCSLLPPDRVAL